MKMKFIVEKIFYVLAQRVVNQDIPDTGGIKNNKNFFIAITLHFLPLKYQ